MLKRSKAISIVLAFVFCMTFLAPALIAPATAEASSTYEVLKAPAVKTSSDPQDLGVVKVTLSDINLAGGDVLTVSLPSDIVVTGKDGKKKTVVDLVYKATALDGIQIVTNEGSTGDLLPKAAFDLSKDIEIKDNNNFDIVMADPITANDTADQYFYIYFNGINLKNTTGDVEVDFNAPSNSSFSSTNGVVIAKSSSSGTTTTSIKKVNDITDKGGTIDSITIAEDAAGSFDFVNGKSFKLEILTKGFSWAPIGEQGDVSYGWGFDSSYDEELSDSDTKASVTGNNEENLNYTIPTSFKGSSSAGKITFNNLKIDVDDSKANPGDEIEVKVKGYEMDSATIVVAKYVDYDVTVDEGTTETLIAGQKDQDLGEFYVIEGAPGSILNGRTIKMTLPTGVEWNEDLGAAYEVVGSGDITLGDPVISGDNDEIIKWNVTTASKNDGVKIKFKDLNVNVSPAFSGDLELEISGSAGVEGTIKVAEVVPAATISVDKVNNVILGKANQKIGDITITEGDVEALLEKEIILELDRDYRFAKEPTVKVIEGDIDIDEDVTIDNETLTIEVKSQSNKTASKILISDIYVDAYRTAPEGPISIEFVNRMTGDPKVGDTALNETSFDKSAGKAVVANCVTAAMGETMGNGQFVIGSNIYQVNGVQKVMDCAPYIKGDRTYVPVRYLAYVLGMTEDDVVWDGASQKVTLTKGDTVVEMTIGSTTLYVNGEAQTMDVAPEITSDRTMLPARFVAEGFGYQVGWDAFSRTVLISK